ncbi:putative porin [Fulvivirga ligni]|uniref:putative porin n=1 Tax=Fulvivirga ligni TaxID=2904246 RepID=UPI001F178595|nr:putative porin [Fulvivirga ligni]UII19902.1 putative porin [Fulvivirga ligni]
MKLIGLLLILLHASLCLSQSVEEKEKPKLTFTGDFRFRIEQDWDSRKSDGTYRDDRSRLRYRLRFGANYEYNHWASFGMRLRTGTMSNQQDPHLTLGAGAQEFDIVPIGLEKLFFKANYRNFSAWLGKNTFPFEKQNELFWSDNVYPEGVTISGKFKDVLGFVPALTINTGHFIMRSSGRSFSEDGYFEGVQLVATALSQKIKVFPGFYYFHQIPVVPDEADPQLINYSIFHVGLSYKLLTNPALSLEMDYYDNLQHYHKQDSLPMGLVDDKEGIVIGVLLGQFQHKGDFTLRAYYTCLQRFSAVDYMAQNDWVRWDYSNYNSPAGRLTNFQGLEIMAGYVVADRLKLKMRYFNVKQLVEYGPHRENGQRVRLDLDIGFN